jgi:hypothetical protein
MRNVVGLLSAWPRVSGDLVASWRTRLARWTPIVVLARVRKANALMMSDPCVLRTGRRAARAPIVAVAYALEEFVRMRAALWAAHARTLPIVATGCVSVGFVRMRAAIRGASALAIPIVAPGSVPVGFVRVRVAVRHVRSIRIAARAIAAMAYAEKQAVRERGNSAFRMSTVATTHVTRDGAFAARSVVMPRDSRARRMGIVAAGSFATLRTNAVRTCPVKKIMIRAPRMALVAAVIAPTARVNARQTARHAHKRKRTSVARVYVDLAYASIVAPRA